MKNPLIIFTLKCTLILYFAACTGINEYTKAVSATPQVTKGVWKVNLLKNEGKDISNDLAGYTLTFNVTGKIIVDRDGEMVTGNWSEDDILKRITINLDTKDPYLTKLNDQWKISTVTKTGIILENPVNPADGRLQITSL